MGITYKYGIDFGTTNSSIAICKKEGRDIITELIPVEESADATGFPAELVRSIVGYKGSQTFVGESGIQSLNGTDDNPIRQIKMRIAAQGARDGQALTIDGRTILYSDVMADILKRLKAGADRYLEGSKIVPSGVVIGIPCSTTDGSKDIYLTALTKAGFYHSREEANRNTEFLDEPVAVALFYGAKATFHNKRSLIFDFGGGTLDLAIVQLKAQNLSSGKGHYPLSVVAKSSIWEGGEELTKRLFTDVFFPAYRAQHCDGDAWEAAKKFKKMGCSGIRPADIYDQVYAKGGPCWSFISALEKAKVQLSSAEECVFSCVCISEAGEKVEFEGTILKRSDFETAMQDMQDNIRGDIKRLFKDNNCLTRSISQQNIDVVVMAGGSSSIPCVQRMLKEEFPERVFIPERKKGPYYIDMMTSICQGLSYEGYRETERVYVDNVTSFDYGIWDEGKNEICTIIPKNTSIAETEIDITRGILPVTKFCRDIEQTDKSASSFYINIYEGKNNILRLDFNRQSYSGYYKIFFSIDAQRGILEVNVYDTGTQKWLDDLTREERTYALRGGK